MTQQQIKFRAWGVNGLAPVRELIMASNSDRWIVYCYDKRENQILKWGGNGNDCVLMRFTGSLDRNEKEVFEGDILENNGMNWEIYCDNSKPCYCMALNGERTSNDHLFVGEAKNSKVIGNIYENPDLLEPKENKKALNNQPAVAQPLY